MITKVAYFKEFQNDLKRVDQRLSLFLESQSEDNVHDLRTALRRVQTRAQILQKRLRKEELGDYLSLSKKLLKSTTAIRDLDIIQDKLGLYHMPNDDLLIRKMNTKRKKLLSKSEKFARKLKRSRPEVSVEDIKEAKLRKKFQKLVAKWNQDIKSLLPLVLKGPEQLEELHILRITCKRLRYILEATHSDLKRIKTLVNWQNYLGEIHDSDVAVQYLSEARQSPSIMNVISEIKKSRDKQYSEFVSLFGNKKSEAEKQPIPQAQVA